MPWTGLGSLLTAHFCRSEIRSPADLQPDAGLRELLHLDVLARGHHLALSLEVRNEGCDGSCDAVAEFLDNRAPLLGGA